MAILTTAGRAALLDAISQQAVHLAWGAGDVSWGSNPPNPSTGAAALFSEIGRREALDIAFVTPDEDGEIEVPGGAYSLSLVPTRYLFLDFHFEFTDDATEVIREVGVFIGTVREAGVSPSKAYLLPSEVDDPGALFLLENLSTPITRSPAIRERFRYVVTL